MFSNNYYYDNCMCKHERWYPVKFYVSENYVDDILGYMYEQTGLMGEVWFGGFATLSWMQIIVLVP